jgi:hypothetical protein
VTSCRFPGALAGLALCLTGTAAAQGLPAYVPINPVITSRSALYFQPYEHPAPEWRTTWQFDWASLIEFEGAQPADYWLLDAEVLRLDATMVKDYGPGNFILIGAGLARAQDGLLDGFFDWYHDVTGLRVPNREVRPKNAFAYEGRFPDGQFFRWDKPGLMLTDLKLGLGVRNTPAMQTLIFATLPTSTHPRGYGRGTWSANGIVTLRSQLSDRWYYEGSGGAGWTPRHGELEEFQNTVFYSASSGLRFRFWGRQAMFFNLFYQSANYHDTGRRSLDRAELSGDMGFILRPGRRAPELILAMSQDLKPSGPAIDAAFRIGLRW